jgi:hypothetical protein
MTTTDIEEILEDIDGAYGQVAVSVYKLCKMGEDEHAANELRILITLLQEDLDRIQNKISGK